MMRKLYLMLAGAAVLTGCMTAPAPTPVTSLAVYPEGSVFVALESRQFATGYAQRKYAYFKGKDATPGIRYFGAFAAAENETFGFSRNQHSIDDAKREAVKQCKKRLGKKRGTCKVIGLRLPKNYRPADAITMSERAAKAYRRYQGKPAPKVFAMGGNGNYASHFSGQPIGHATKHALANCRYDSGLPRYPLEGGQSCKIIASEP